MVQANEAQQVYHDGDNDGGDGAYSQTGNGLLEVFVHAEQTRDHEIAQTACHVAGGDHGACQQGDFQQLGHGDPHAVGGLLDAGETVKELGNENLDVKVEKLKDENVASMAVLSEENRRMQEMMKMYGMGGMDASMFGSQATLVLNANHPLVQFLVANKDSENVSIICKQLYDLAMLAHKPLSPEEMTAFVKRSNDIMMLLTK